MKTFRSLLAAISLRPLRKSVFGIHLVEGEPCAGQNQDSSALSPNGAVQASPGQRPGLDLQRRTALKGRPNATKLRAPLQGSRLSTTGPRALPWATLGRPVGANDTFRRGLSLLLALLVLLPATRAAADATEAKDAMTHRGATARPGPLRRFAPFLAHRAEGFYRGQR